MWPQVQEEANKEDDSENLNIVGIWEEDTQTHVAFLEAFSIYTENIRPAAQ